MNSALQVTEWMLIMLPGIWQCVVINYMMVIFLCRKWKSFIASRTRRRGSCCSCWSPCPCCSSGKFYQFRGTGVRPRLAQEVPDLQSVGVCGPFQGQTAVCLAQASLWVSSLTAVQGRLSSWVYFWCEQVKPFLYSGFTG